MPRRQRWTPVRGTGTRVASPAERALLAAADLPLRVLRQAPVEGAPPLAVDRVHEVLVLRLDRIGDLLMSLPALTDLRRAYPGARIRLAVGRWSEEIARRAPVDDVLVWSAPWVGRPSEGAQTRRALWSRALGLRAERLDLALDLQGDVRAAWLMALTGARERIGYANTGGARLLTRVVPLDETVSWIDQNRRAVAVAAGPEAIGGGAPVDLLTADDRARAKGVLAAQGLDGLRPLVGLHPSGGRPVKQWAPARWREVAA
ncbi:MAG TPA: glycosyltransferase family 9 protein, partial [Vicinamibacteria bacterium]|nr:glycosyltransferase family 9 protein [Vicinamibacteria bacterium]